MQRSILASLLFIVSMTCCGPGKPEQASLDQEIAIERWPEEGVPIIAWADSGNALPLYSQPGADKPANYLAVQKDQQLQWDKSLILVKKLGKLKILKNCVMSGFIYDSLQDHKLLGGKPKEINFSADTILDVVCYAAEGDYIFHYQNKYVEMSGSNDCQQMIVLPQTEWWVRLRRNTRHLGWVKVDGQKVSVVDRRF